MSALDDACRKLGAAARSPAVTLQPAGVTVPEYTQFPVAALPVVLREFVLETAAAVDCDPAFAALTVAGAAVGAALVVSPKRGFREPAAVWTCVVADSGTGKSPALRPVEMMAGGINRELREAHAAAVAKYQADLETWKDDPDSAPKPVKPAREYFVIRHCTVERIAEMLAASPRGLLMTRDELAAWFGSFTRYKGRGGGSDVPNWLSMYDAGPVSVHRRTGEPRDVEADRGFVAVCGGIQPDVLRQHLSDPAHIESGLAARLLFAMPPKACPRWTDAEIDPATERRFGDVLRFLR